jgi:serpin B
MPMMYQMGNFNLYRGDNFSAIEIPYTEDELALWIILPNLDNHLSLDSLTVETIQKGFEPHTVELQMPKFDIRSDLSLIEPLKKMGMTLPFSPKADFSLMLEGESIAIDKVKHQAHFSVDEAGTVATAASGVSMTIKSKTPQESALFLANRPFYFLLMDKTNQVVLFFGHFNNPGK